MAVFRYSFRAVLPKLAADCISQLVQCYMFLLDHENQILLQKCSSDTAVMMKC